jgi:hypothetical protein
MIFLGIKRSSNPEKEYAGRICLNYYLADDYLQIPTGRGTKIDRYCAENYAKAKFLSGDYSLFSRFLQRNIKLFHKYGVKLGVPYNEFSGGTQYAAPIITKMWEKILSGKFGDRVESKLKSSQISRIEANPIARNQSDLIAYNDKEIRFHPSKTVQN